MLRQGRFTEGSSRDEMRRILSLAAANEHKHLVLFFHGGLVDERGGLDTMNQLIKPYAAYSYPLFFIWHTGWNEVLLNALPKIADNALGFQRLNQIVGQMVAAKLGNESGTRSTGDELPAPAIAAAQLVDAENANVRPQAHLTDVDEAQFVAALNADPGLRALFATPSDVGGKGISDVTRAADPYMDPQFIAPESSALAEGNKGLDLSGFLSPGFIAQALQVLGRIFTRFLNGRDHGIHLTISEEILRAFYVGAIGRGLWDAMKDESLAAFGPDPETFGGTCLLRELALLDPNSFDRITLLGHSAGSIYIIHLLEAAARELPNTKFDVVFFAPAATCDLAAQQFERRPSQIAHLRSFFMNDTVELADSIFDGLLPAVRFIYPSSLLYAISGLLEDIADKPLLGMDRFMESSRFRSLDASVSSSAKAVVDSGSSVISKTDSSAVAGRQSQATTHGGFPNDKETLESTLELLKGNWS